MSNLHMQFNLYSSRSTSPTARLAALRPHRWLLHTAGIFFFTFWLWGGYAQAQTIRYVKATASGTGTGASWANASADLQAMIDYVAANGTGSKEVWVAAGTYKPTKDPFGSASPTDPRDKTFYVKDGVKIYGGFSASTPEATLAARSISTNVTLLSGDIGTANATDNAYHVVLASANSTTGVGVTIDGFSVTGGNAKGSSSITVNGNSIYRDSGGGIYTNYGTNTLSNNTLYNNIANSAGGIFTSFGTNTLSNNTLYNNTANGGGIYTYFGTNTLSNNTLYNNTASFYGGGIYTETCTNTLSNNTLYNNTASRGGGIYTSSGTNTLSNNTLYNNSASENGGGIYTYIGTNTLSNNIFWANIKGTDATVAGADYYAAGTNGNTFKNNLLQLAASNYPKTATGNYAIGTGATGNIFAQDPKFFDAANPAGADGKHRTSDDGLALDGCSPAINAGTNTGTPALDILGNGIYNTTKDMGAYERQTPAVCCPSGTTLLVNASVSGGTGDGSTWANAYASLSDALAIAHTCTNIKTIKVAAGTYKPTKAFNAGAEITTTDGRDVVFHIPDGVTIEGGYNAATNSRDITANVTVLSGDIDNNNTLDNGNAYHVVLASANSTTGVGVTIDGFSVTGGNAKGSSSITVNGNSIYRDSGGGIYTNFGTNTLSNNTLYNNTANSGGGIYTFNGTNTLNNNTLYNNTAADFGGGIYTSSGTNTLNNNTFSGNSASYLGGGLVLDSGTNNTASNNTFFNNTATNGGGGLETYDGTNTLSNNIFWANIKGTDATVAGADYYAAGTNGNTFKNNLLQLAASNYPKTATGNYAIGTGATGNIFAQDPKFFDAANPAGADGKHRTSDDGLA